MLDVSARPSMIMVLVGFLGLLLLLTGVEGQMFDRLYDDLFMNYNPDTLPMRSRNNPVPVTLGLTIIQVDSLNVESGVMQLDAWLDMEWTDGRLVWSPPDYDEIHIINIKSSKMWKPDIEIFNGGMKRTKSLVMLSADGKVFHSTKTKFSIPCEMVGYEVNKTLTCAMKLGTWTHSGFLIDVQKRSEDVDLSIFRSNRWNIVSTRLVNNTVHYACCPEPFPDVTAHLVFSDSKAEGFSIANWAQNIFK